MDRLESLRAWLGGVLPPDFGFAAGQVIRHGQSPFAEEEALVARAVAARQAEFRAGRGFAREALSQLGRPASAILIRDGRDPAWPAGIIGSITHTRDLAAAVVARDTGATGIGLDLETGTPLERRLVPQVCRAEEMIPLAGLMARGIDDPKLRFVAKEAYFKAVFPKTRTMFDFLDASVTFDVSTCRFGVRVTDPALARRLPPPDQVTGWFQGLQGLLAAVVIVA